MGLKISIGKQIVDLKKLQNYEDKVKKNDEWYEWEKNDILFFEYSKFY